MSTESVFHKQVVQAWISQVAATDKLVEQFSDEQWMTEVAPSRNRGIYLLGHLIAVHDMMLPLLRFGNANFPEWHETFSQKADRAVATLPSPDELKQAWKKVNEQLNKHIGELAAEEWCTRHGNISDEDFVKEPHRTRLSVLLSRTNHMSYHRGQLILLVKK